MIVDLQVFLVLCAVHVDETLGGYRKSNVIVNSAFNMFSDCLRVLWWGEGGGLRVTPRSRAQLSHVS